MMEMLIILGVEMTLQINTYIKCVKCDFRCGFFMLIELQQSCLLKRISSSTISHHLQLPILAPGSPPSDYLILPSPALMKCH